MQFHRYAALTITLAAASSCVMNTYPGSMVGPQGLVVRIATGVREPVETIVTGRYEGTLVYVTEDSLKMHAVGHSRAVTLGADAILKLEVYRGRRATAGSTARGAGKGAAAGAVVGAFLGLVGGAIADAAGWHVDYTEALGIGAAYGAINGATVGATQGATVGDKVWQEVSFGGLREELCQCPIPRPIADAAGGRSAPRQ